MGAIVVLAEADNLHGVLAVQQAVPCLLVDVQVLARGWVVIVHIKGHLEIDSANGVHQFPDSLPLHQDIEVRVDSSKVAHLLLQGGHSLFHPLLLWQVAGPPIPSVHHIEPLLCAPCGAGVDHRVPEQADGIDSLILSVIGYQQHCVCGIAHLV